MTAAPEPEEQSREPAHVRPAPSAVDPNRNPDQRKAQQILIVGKKGQGKTELGFLLFDHYRGPKLVIDPNGDLKMPPGTVELAEPIPTRWPERDFPDAAHQVARFVPDFGSKTWRDAIDECLGLAYLRGDMCVFVDECHTAFPTGSAGQPGPNAMRILRQGRHRRLFLVNADLRPMLIDPLVLANADWIYVFQLRNPDDRKRIARSIGWDERDFDDGVAALRPHGYLRYDDAIDDLADFPPLPAELLKHHRS